MARYPNGQVPRSELVEFEGDLWFPGTLARWKTARQRIQDRTGVRLTISPPAYGASNVYRDLAGQQSARTALGIQASIPGRSSHGGVWSGQTRGHSGLSTWVEGVESGAFDVWNWAAVPWDIFREEMERVGLIVDITVPREQWHVVDLDPWGTRLTNSAAGGGSTDLTEAEVNEILKRLAEMEKRQKSIESKLAWIQARIGGTVGNKKKGWKASATLDHRLAWIADRIGGSYKNDSISTKLADLHNDVEQIADEG